MGLRYFLVSAQSDPFEPDPVGTGVGKGKVCFLVYPPIPSPEAGSQVTMIEIQNDEIKSIPTIRSLYQ